MTDWADKIAEEFVTQAKTILLWKHDIALALRQARTDALDEAVDAVARAWEPGKRTSLMDFTAAIRGLKDKQP